MLTALGKTAPAQHEGSRKTAAVLGESLRQQRLPAPPPEAMTALKKYGGFLFDLSGDIKGMVAECGKPFDALGGTDVLARVEAFARSQSDTRDQVAALYQLASGQATAARAWLALVLEYHVKAMNATEDNPASDPAVVQELSGAARGTRERLAAHNAAVQGVRLNSRALKQAQTETDRAVTEAEEARADNVRLKVANKILNGDPLDAEDLVLVSGTPAAAKTARRTATTRRQRTR